MDGECPAGTQPWDDGCSDTFPCACEYVCAPTCGERAVCSPAEPDNECVCHPAFAGTPGACEWVGIHPNSSFDQGCNDWEMFTSFLTAPEGEVSTEVVGGRLHLRASRCNAAAASGLLSVPDTVEFPAGGALRFDYLALADGTPDAGQGAPFRVEGSELAVTPDGPESHDICLSLDPEARIDRVMFIVEAGGLCSQPLTLDLWVDNLRVVESEACG